MVIVKKNIKILSALSTVLFTATAVLAVWPCLLIYNQPKAPEGLKKFRKF
ncbi:MAG: cyclic lactone autoinducer peptide [Eubacteriales bacterium]